MKPCVWVREIGILHAIQNVVSRWEIWSAHNTRQEAVQSRNAAFKKRPKWASARFFRATNRIRKYVPSDDWRSR